MANKIKEEARRLYDSYGADEEGMDKVIMEHYKEIMGTDKFSKMIWSDGGQVPVSPEAQSVSDRNLSPVRHDLGRRMV